MAVILVVEDDEQFRNMLVLQLSRQGHRVIHACSAKEGLQLYQQACPDLILTDLIMPDMDGIELIMQLRRLGNSTPIIAMSGGGRSMKTESNLKMVELLGAAATLAKPFSREQLLQAIEDVLSGTAK